MPNKPAIAINKPAEQARIASLMDAIAAAKADVSEEKAKMYEDGTIDGKSANIKMAEEKIRQHLGEIITSKDGIDARVSSNSIGKLVSGDAIRASKKSQKFTAKQHLAAAADIVDLFKNSIKIYEHPDIKNDPNIKGMYRFIAPLYNNNVAFITVKEATIQGNRIYSIELIELGRLEGKLEEIKEKLNSSLSKPSEGLETTNNPIDNIEKCLKDVF